MAKGKNEILLSIALEGDQEIKSKLKAVGDEGKKSLADIERQVGRAGENAGRRFAESATGPLSKVKEAISPLFEGGGFGGLLKGLGGAALGAGLPAALTGLAAQLAKIREETELTESRFKALGASGDAFSKLRDSARKVGADPKDLAGANEDFLSYKRRQELQSPYGVADVNEEQFRKAQRALIAGGVLDGASTSDAAQRARSFLGDLYAPHDVGNGELAQGLTAGGLKALGPVGGNRLARALGGELGIPIRNAEELDLLLGQRDAQGRTGVIRPDAVFRALQHDEPSAVKEADKRRTFGERVSGSLGELQRTFGDILGGPSGKVGTDAGKTLETGIDALTRGVQGIRPTAEAFGKSGRELGDRTGIPGLGSAGEALGTAEGLTYGIIRDSARGYGRMGSVIGDLLGSTPIGGFLGRALADPGALQERTRPPEGPSALQPLPPSQAQPQPTQQQTSAWDSFIQNLNAKLNDLGPPQDTKVREPVDSLGIRGDLEDNSKNVAGTVNEVEGSLKQLASAFTDAAASISAAAKGTGTEEPVQAAAGGGWIRRFIGGGGVSGPGTSTSDSIPAMLSDGEYVIKAESARKLGRGALDYLNAGHYSRGGRVAHLRGGGLSSDWFDPELTDEESINLLNETVLSPQQLKLVQLNNAKTPEESIRLLNRFVLGRSGGGPVGHFADGGTVSLPGFDVGGPAMAHETASVADIGDGGAGPWGDLTHVGTADLRTDRGDVRVTGKISALKEISDAARDAANFQTGPSPGWAYGGR
ncbi:hypothetical protein N2603_23340 [Bradyrhizobium huanghuaihaiense]|uniref:hypothetical protein n=1 Tax=Bradyrhizobium huanghuaihaiense TaxID=990078 RepID=UPI0021AA64C8|nr:hypothetical protein [Bradyrhizobium sp. CB3035]UWU73041.1 hypothetical protein N2603_23340 [Bradyrhizobium sp. CB3035]